MQSKTYIKYANGIPKRPIMWTHTTIYVDIHTGEQITKYIAKTQYKIIKHDEHITLNKNATRGHIERTNECQRNPQLNLFTKD